MAVTHPRRLITLIEYKTSFDFLTIKLEFFFCVPFHYTSDKKKHELVVKSAFPSLNLKQFGCQSAKRV